MSKEAYLTKSTFVYAPQCDKWLWNKFHDRPDITPLAVGSSADIGNRVGIMAHQLFPGGVEVTEKAYEHERAVERTLQLMADEKVTAIYEAAFEFDDTRARVDILERLSNSTWGICEVKATGNIHKDTKAAPLLGKYSRDVAVQHYVVTGAGVQVTSVELIFVNNAYDGSPYPNLDIDTFLIREEVMGEVQSLGIDIKTEIKTYMGILADAVEPTSEPAKSKCNKMPGDACPFWDSCTANKPEDWVDILYWPSGKQLNHLKAEGKHTLSDMVLEDALKEPQKRMIQAVHENADIVDSALKSVLAGISLPAIHLDFEYLAQNAITFYEGTKPFENVPFQYSAHRLNADGSYDHIDEFLAEGNVDPRREFAERLVKLFKGGNEPIMVWHIGAEGPVMKKLIETFTDLAPVLTDILDRMVDLLVVFRNHVVLRKMISKKSMSGGLFSLKNVGPSISEDFSYDNLDGVAHGGQAVEAYIQMITGELPDGISRKELRTAMKKYCQNDTLGTTLIHQKLLEMGG